MNKLLTKIVGAALGLTMTVGVGVAVANSNKAVEPVYAAEITAEETTNDLQTAKGWTISSGSSIGDIVTSFSLDDHITISTSGAANCGTIWGTSTLDWRLYQNKNGDVTATAESGYIIKSITYNYNVSSNGKLYNGSTAVNSGSTVTVNASSKTLTAGATSGTSGQVRITKFKVVYEQQASKSITIGDAAVINESNSLSITATLTGVTGTPTWTASPNSGVSFTAENPTTMTVDNTVANATEIEVTATIDSTVSNVKKVVVSNNSGDSQHPFEADEAVKLIRNGLYNSSNTYYVSGYVKSSSYSSQYGNATIYISTSANNTGYNNTDCIELFRAVGDTGVDISNLQQGFFVVASGTMTFYENTQPEFNAGCIVRSVTTPPVTVDSVTVVADASVDAHGASSVDAEVEYDVSYEGTVGTKAISVHIENSQGQETGFEYTTPASGTFVVTFTANETYTITVTSDEDGTKSDSAEIVVSGIVASVTAEFEKYTTTIVSGDEYVFISASYVMGNTIASNRVANGTLPTISNDKFTTSDYSIIYIITKVGDYYTIQNKNTSHYLAGTSDKNKAQFLETASDNHAKWTITNSGDAWTFENLGRASDSDTPANRYLRNNTTSGWACYGSSQGGTVNLYHKVDTSRALTNLSITTASSKLTFSQGEALSVPSLVVTATFSSNPTTVEYSGMTSSDSKGLTFSPVLGSTLTTTGDVTVSISLTYNGHTESTSFTINVISYTAPTYTKVTSSNVPIDLRGTYLVVYEDETDAYIMNSALGSSNSTMDVVNNYVSGTINGNTITGSVSIDAAAVQIVRRDIEGHSKYFLKSSANTFYSATTSKLNVVTDPSADIEFSLSDLNDGLRPHLGSNVIKFNTTSNQMRFRVYAASSTSMAEVSLYKLNTTSAINSEVSGFVSSFYESFKSTANEGLCDANGNSNVTNLNNAWSSKASVFANLSPDAQGILACTTYTHNAETAGTQADIIDRYDYIYSKYSANLTEGDFMNRSGLSVYQATGASLSQTSIIVVSNNNAIIAIVVAISMMTVTAIGAYYFLRKRKEQ